MWLVIDTIRQFGWDSFSDTFAFRLFSTQEKAEAYRQKVLDDGCKIWNCEIVVIQLDEGE